MLRAPLFLLLLAPVTGRATTLLHQATRGLVRGSSDIVVGKVLSTRSRLDESRRHLGTEVSFEVSQSLKGASGVVTLVQLGGDLGGMHYEVPGSPVFRPDEEALLFLWRDAHGQAQ